MGNDSDSCDFCGRALYDDSMPDVYHVEFHGSVVSAYHERCQQIFDGYLAFRSQHNVSCHLKDCQKGPKNPFAETMVKADA